MLCKFLYSKLNLYLRKFRNYKVQQIVSLNFLQNTIHTHAHFVQTCFEWNCVHTRLIFSLKQNGKHYWTLQLVIKTNLKQNGSIVAFYGKGCNHYLSALDALKYFLLQNLLSHLLPVQSLGLVIYSFNRIPNYYCNDTLAMTLQKYINIVSTKCRSLWLK